MMSAMEPKRTPEEALREVVGDMLAERGDAAAAPAAEWSEDLTRRLAEVGFKVSKDYHYRSADDPHPADCYHCGRAENPDPFVIPGTPLELQSSEGEEGRFRHWGGDDVWICRAHPTYMSGDLSEGDVERTMDLYQAVEHLAARDGITDLLHRTIDKVERMKEPYATANATRLAALDAHAPDGGHQGVAARKK